MVSEPHAWRERKRRCRPSDFPIASSPFPLPLNRPAARILLGLQNVLGPAQIPPVIFIRGKSQNPFPLRRQPRITVDDRERPILRDQPQEARRDYMQAGKSQCRHACRDLPLLPCPEQSLPVKEQIARGPSVLYGQGRERLLVLVKLHHPPQVDAADHIHVMQNKRLTIVLK